LGHVHIIQDIAYFRFNDGQVLFGAEDFNDRNGIIEVLARGLSQDDADHFSILVKEGTAAIAGRGGCGEPYPPPLSRFFFRGVRRIETVPDDNSLPKGIANGIDLLVESGVLIHWEESFRFGIVE
jgi:hypothetical protein